MRQHQPSLFDPPRKADAARKDPKDYTLLEGFQPMDGAPRDGTRVDLQDADGAIAFRCHWGLCDGPGWSQHGRMNWTWAPTDFEPVGWRPATPLPAAPTEVAE